MDVLMHWLFTAPNSQVKHVVYFFHGLSDSLPPKAEYMFPVENAFSPCISHRRGTHKVCCELSVLLLLLSFCWELNMTCEIEY